MESSVIVDETLAGELRSPYTDQRYGVNIIVRPSVDISEYICFIQNQLRTQEPDQYYYPVETLHLTLVEICFSRPQNEAVHIGQTVAAKIKSVLHPVPVFQVKEPMLTYDARACALKFTSTSGIGNVRRLITERLRTESVEIEQRYQSESAHITFMRYTRPLSQDWTQWLTLLLALSQKKDIVWSIGEAWLTWGATWYGMRSRIQEFGPCPLTAV